MKIICIGSACKDIFFPTSEGTVFKTPKDLAAKSKLAFELGAKYKIEERYESLGGCAANVACGLAKLGMQSACYSHIGDDTSADWIKKELEKNGVGINLITQEKKCPSDLSAIVVDKNSAERVIFSNQKANGKLKIVPDNLKGAEWYFLGDLHGKWEKITDAVFKAVQKNGVKIANNPRQINIHENVKKIIETISNSDALFLNKDESIKIISAMGNFSEKELDNEVFLAKKLKEKGARIAVITDGVRGAWAIDEKKIFFAPGIKVKAVDSTGAGDSFCSGFIAAYIKGKNIQECLKWGIANSSSVVRFYGGIEGLLGEVEIKKKAQQVKTRNL